MEVVYTTAPKREADKVYRDPRQFFGPIRAATSVTVEGNYPEIRQAYEALRIPVKRPRKPKTDDTE